MTDRPDHRRGGAPDATGEVIERLSADEAFELLGNGTRLGVLRALFETGPDGRLAFSELRETVGVRDSGQFNYHLDRLVGASVDRDDEGYALTTAGRHVVGSILAGQYTKALETEPVDVGTPCPDCGTPLRGVFERGFGRVRCGDCDRTVISLPVPPGVVEDYPREEWPFVAEQWVRRQVERANAGFCPTCEGPMTSRLETDVDDVERFDITEPFAAVELFSCDRCGEQMYSSAEASVVTEPAVVAFYHERGIDVGATPIWELDWALEPRAEVVEETPLRVEVPVDCGGDRLVVTLDGSGDVVETRRSDRS